MGEATGGSLLVLVLNGEAPMPVALHISSLTSRFGMADDTRGECFVLDYPPSFPPVTVRRLIKGLGP